MKPFFKTEEFSGVGCSRQIDFDNQKVGHPADHALHDADLFKLQKDVNAGQFVRQIDVDKGKCHGIAAHNPSSVRNEIFITCGGIGKVSYKKPADSHGREANLGRQESIRVQHNNFTGAIHFGLDREAVSHRKWQHQNGAQKAAKNVYFSEPAMQVRPFLPPFTGEQKRANDDGGNGGGDVRHQQKIADNRQAWDNNASVDLVCIQHGSKESHGNGSIEHDHCQDKANDCHKRYFGEFSLYVV